MTARFIYSSAGDDWQPCTWGVPGRYLQRMINSLEVDVNRRFILVAFVSAMAMPAFAADFTDTAEVTSAVPIYGSINEPRQQCWTETVTTRQEAPRSYGRTVLGGITGGFLGSTIGDGNGQIAAAAAGAVIGALIGNNADQRNTSSVAIPQQVQRCQLVDHYRKGITGYKVTYNYNGRNSTTVLPYDPGQQVKVGIGVVGLGSGQDVAPQPAAQSQYAQPLPARQITYVDANGQVPIWAIKPYKRPRPAPENY